MKALTISDPRDILRGVVYPDYGGMLGELFFRGRPIFRLDPEMLRLSTILAGGCPVLFPFPSLTAGDRYELNGKCYSMPFHGLVKHSTFSVAESSRDAAELYATGNAVTRESNYPFDFRLVLEYVIDGEATLTMVATVENESSTPMPHYFGWHPYFHVSDRHACRITHGFGRYYSYLDGRAHDASDAPDMHARTDYVYSERKGDVVSVENDGDGYRVDMILDEAFQVLTLCTRFEDCLCVEPWMGLPDSINSGKHIQWIGGHSSRRYAIRLKVSG
jgi:galactose mutarotase-like enzyme